MPADNWLIFNVKKIIFQSRKLDVYFEIEEKIMGKATLVSNIFFNNRIKIQINSIYFKLNVFYSFYLSTSS